MKKIADLGQNSFQPPLFVTSHTYLSGFPISKTVCKVLFGINNYLPCCVYLNCIQWQLVLGKARSCKQPNLNSKGYWQTWVI